MCSHFCICDIQENYDLFGSGGAERLCAEYELSFLGRIPLDPVSLCV